jgi:hypothetical protein
MKIEPAPLSVPVDASKMDTSRDANVANFCDLMRELMALHSRVSVPGENLSSANQESELAKSQVMGKEMRQVPRQVEPVLLELLPLEEESVQPNSDNIPIVPPSVGLAHVLMPVLPPPVADAVQPPSPQVSSPLPESFASPSETLSSPIRAVHAIPEPKLHAETAAPQTLPPPVADAVQPPSPQVSSPLPESFASPSETLSSPIRAVHSIPEPKLHAETAAPQTLPPPVAGAVQPPSPQVSSPLPESFASPSETLSSPIRAVHAVAAPKSLRPETAAPQTLPPPVADAVQPPSPQVSSPLPWSVASLRGAEQEVVAKAASLDARPLLHKGPDAVVHPSPQLAEASLALGSRTITPPPPVAEASLQSLRMEIVSFVQNPSRPQVTLEIRPPEYGRILVRGEMDQQGRVAVRLVVESSVVKEQVLLHLQRFPVPAEIEIMTFEEYSEHSESSGRQRREEAPRQAPRRQEKPTTEFSI